MQQSQPWKRGIGRELARRLKIIGCFFCWDEFGRKVCSLRPSDSLLLVEEQRSDAGETSTFCRAGDGTSPDIPFLGINRVIYMKKSVDPEIRSR
jgi:hypothetical protein